MKKIIFPFYDETRHNFLFGKWWFRLAIVFYIVVLIVIAVVAFNDNFSYIKTCQNTAFELYEPFSDGLKNELAQCEKMAYGALLPSVGYAIILVLAFYYLVQVIFFKIIINYVVLGNKK